MGKQWRKISSTKLVLCKKSVTSIDCPRKEKEKRQITSIRNQRGDFGTDSKNIKRRIY